MDFYVERPLRNSTASYRRSRGHVLVHQHHAHEAPSWIAATHLEHRAVMYPAEGPARRRCWRRSPPQCQAPAASSAFADPLVRKELP
jgi:hypothetical protein